MRLHLRVAEDGALEVVTALGERVEGLAHVEMTYPSWADDDPEGRPMPHPRVTIAIRREDAMLNADSASTREMAAVKPLRPVHDDPTEEQVREHPTQT